jgi:hypothetical protein
MGLCIGFPQVKSYLLRGELVDILRPERPLELDISTSEGIQYAHYARGCSKAFMERHLFLFW